MNGYTTHQKVAIVTGANKGIGRAAAEQLAASGMSAVVGARDPHPRSWVDALVETSGESGHEMVQVTVASTVTGMLPRVALE